MVKKIIICLIIFSLIMFSYKSCFVKYRAKKFVDKYEFEDFSQFKNVSIFIRGFDEEKNPIIMIDAPYWIKDTNVGLYVVRLNKKNYRIIKTGWTWKKSKIADTIKLQRLAQAFIKYKIPRLDVDTAENVFVYIGDPETLALTRFADNNELLKHCDMWKKFKGNWYKPK